MSRSVDFYYDYISPASYLAWTQMGRLADKTGALVNYKPVFLGGIFKASGNSSPAQVKPKFDWMMADLGKHAALYDVPFVLNPHFIFNSMAIMRGAMWARANHCLEEYNQAMFEAVWVNQKDMSDPQEIKAVLDEAGLDSAAAMAAMNDPQFKQALIQSGDEAVERGVFGAPTMFVNGELFFGQDRLDWVERALLR